MYKVLDYESAFEILDEKGKDTILTKKEKVRFLQNTILVFQDQA